MDYFQRFCLVTVVVSGFFFIGSISRGWHVAEHISLFLMIWLSVVFVGYNPPGKIVKGQKDVG
jgi:hypothetical protein